MGLTKEQSATIADANRVWQVRRFCQVLYTENQLDHESFTASRDVSHGDAALSAMLRGVAHELGADLTAISLLDERTQFFLSVVHSNSLHDPTVRKTDWFGCENVLFSGGICERTITRDYGADTCAAYEIPDLIADESTRSLNVVNGQNASFRHYAGVPIISEDGVKVGALFMFTNQPSSQPLPPSKSRYLWETSRHAMNHIVQTIRALDNARSMRCNAAINIFLRTPHFGNSLRLSAKHGIDPREQIYHTAADLLRQTLDLEGIIIQPAPRVNLPERMSTSFQEKVLSESCSKSHGPVEDSIARRLLSRYPAGAVFYTVSDDNGGMFYASTQEDLLARKKIELPLCEQFPGIQQFVFMPLWDSYYGRNTSFVFGWTSTSTRVYSAANDLFSLSAFGTALIAQIQRLEGQTLSQKTSDFLGSLSHEMLSPLHGILACIEHLESTDPTPEQLDLLQSAEACGKHLKNNIGNVLQISKIGSMMANPSPTSRKLSNTDTAQAATSNGKTMSALLEHIVCSTAQQSRRINKPLDSQKNAAASGQIETILVVDVELHQPDFIVGATTKISFIIQNLLDNCLKFTDVYGCIRITLHVDAKKVCMKFVDSGRGMSSEYVRHRLFEPFSQRDAIDHGLGLGLALVHHVTRSLNGTIDFTSDECQGTEVSISFPIEELAIGFAYAEGTAESISSNPERIPVAEDEIQLFMPRRWQRQEDTRHKACLDMFRTSLSSTLLTHADNRLKTWSSTHDSPHVIIALYSDLDALKTSLGETYDHTWKIVLCPDPATESTLIIENVKNYVAVVGPLIPTKIHAALAQIQQHRLSERDASSQTQASPQPLSPLERARTSSSQLSIQDTIDGTDGSNHAQAIDAIQDEIMAMQAQQPRFLLVDDNAINLKVAAMYARKCSSTPSILAGGGRDAINAYRTVHLNEHFDIILLDLSMPEVSGFEVASTIRQFEKENTTCPRVYIAALTGLVSDRDRDAAFAAGVDEYVTKPASLKDLQCVVANWRKGLA